MEQNLFTAGPPLVVLLKLADLNITLPQEAHPVEPTEGVRRSIPNLDKSGLSCVNLSGWDEIDEALAVIRPQMETKLRNNGFRLLSEDEWLATPSAPRLEISVRTAKSRGSLEALELSAGPDPEISGTRTAFVFCVGMRLTQEVQLASNARVKFAASTWSWEGWLGAEQQRPFKAIRADVLRGVDAFIDDWKRAQKEP